MTQEIIEFLKTWDWSFITLLIGFIVFVGSLTFVIFRIKKHKPSFLRSEKIIKSESEEDTTYDWDTIKSIFSNCLLFAGGFYMISNVVVFVVFREWYTDPLFVAAIAAVFAINIFQTFDKFYRKMMK